MKPTPYPRQPVRPNAGSAPKAGRASNPGTGRDRFAFSLIELIGVMAVMTILALALAPVLTKAQDRATRDREVRNLETLSAGLRAHILRHQNIPSPTNFATVIAAELGWQVTNVLANDRHQRRAYLIDPSVTATIPIPFTQSAFGVTNEIRPTLGVLILSSLGSPLPTNVLTGFAATSNAFWNIWNVADGHIPAGWTWNGLGEDLLVQRMDLDSLFVPLLLNYDTYTLNSTNRGRFTIGASATNTLPVVPSYVASYFQGSVLGLHSHVTSTNSLQAREVLQYPLSFVYEGDAWRGQLFLGRGLKLTSGLDLQAAHDLFIAASTNLNAQGSPPATPNHVVTAVSNYLRTYVTWYAAGYPQPHSTYTAVKNAQGVLETTSKNLLHNPTLE